MNDILMQNRGLKQKVIGESGSTPSRGRPLEYRHLSHHAHGLLRFLLKCLVQFV